MATYLRFTATAEGDIERGTSLFKTPSMKKAKVLEGICAFSIDTFGLTDEEVESKVRMYARNYSYYSNCGVAALIEGDYLHNNANGEGVVIKPYSVIREIEL